MILEHGAHDGLSIVENKTRVSYLFLFYNERKLFFSFTCILAIVTRHHHKLLKDYEVYDLMHRYTSYSRLRLNV